MYTSPVLVLDFQSLYPSIIIAYNYCYTTCLGRAIPTDKNQFKRFGASSLKLHKGLLGYIHELIEQVIMLMVLILYFVGISLITFKFLLIKSCLRSRKYEWEFYLISINNYEIELLFIIYLI